MICRHCYREPAEGESHGFLVCDGGPGRSAAVRQDTIIGGFLAENAWREPRYFDSQRRYEKALDESGLMLKPKKQRGADPLSPETLEWAKQRLMRMYARTRSVEIQETVREESFTVEAEA